MSRLTDDPVIAAAVHGARSVGIRGWIAAEAEQAAIERVARAATCPVAVAYLAGRAAALDELRRLTRGRTAARTGTVPLDTHDAPQVEPGFARVEAAVTLDHVLGRARLTPRERQVMLLLADGMTGRQAALAMGVDPSRVTQLARAARRKVAARTRPAA